MSDGDWIVSLLSCNTMKYYAAPLEGITGYIYRRAHFHFFPGIDRYYTPFLVPKEKRDLSSRERGDVCPEHNEGMTVIPQILTNNAEDFLRVTRTLQREYGYGEVNLNLGCPSKTVVSKGRGAGFLAVPKQLDRFLDEIFEKTSVKISIKTRIGRDDPKEYEGLLDIYRKYPLSELIVHPRVQQDYYNNKPNLEAFAWTFGQSSWPVCYNGDLCTVTDVENMQEQFPKVSAVMLGRGLLTNPDLVERLKVRESGGIYMEAMKKAASDRKEIEKAERRRRYEFYRKILEDYRNVMDGERPVLFKMKELWFYMSQAFNDYEKHWKRMKKTNRLKDFEEIVESLFNEKELIMSEK